MDTPTPPWTSPEAQAALANDAVVYTSARSTTTTSTRPTRSGVTASLAAPLLAVATLASLVFFLANLGGNLLSGFPILLLLVTIALGGATVRSLRNVRGGSLVVWGRTHGLTQGNRQVSDAAVPLIRHAQQVHPGVSMQGTLGPYDVTAGTFGTSDHQQSTRDIDMEYSFFLGYHLTNLPWRAALGPGANWTAVRVSVPDHVTTEFAGIAVMSRGDAATKDFGSEWSEYSVGDAPFGVHHQLFVAAAQDAAVLPALFTQDFAAVLAGTGGALQFQFRMRDLLVFQRGTASPEALDALCRAALLVALQFDDAARRTIAARTAAPAAAAPPPPPPAGQDPPGYTTNAA